MILLRRLLMVCLLGSVGCKSCEESGSTDADLPDISTSIQFQSVAELGAHRMTAQIRRKDVRSGEVSLDNDETLVLVWNDADSFINRVLRDGVIQSEDRVVDGVPYSRRRAGLWIQKEDAEPMRVSVYTTWNVWENALDLYSDRIAYSEPVSDIYEGRDARRYTLSLAASDARSQRAVRRQRLDGEPIHLAGQVWLDGERAVRLKAEVTGMWKKGDLEKTVQLSMARTDLGQTQSVEIPDGIIEKRSP